MKEKWGRFGRVAVGSAGLLTGVGVAKWKAWPAVEKFSSIVDLSVVTVFPSLSAMGSWEEEVLLFSMDFTVSQNCFEFVQQDANFCFEKASLSVNCLCILVPNFPEKLHITGAIRC